MTASTPLPATVMARSRRAGSTLGVAGGSASSRLHKSAALLKGGLCQGFYRLYVRAYIVAIRFDGFM